MAGTSLNTIYGSLGSLNDGTNTGPKDEIDQAYADALFDKQVAKLREMFAGEESFDLDAFFKELDLERNEEPPYGESDRFAFMLKQVEEEYVIGRPDMFGGNDYYGVFDDPMAAETPEPAFAYEPGFTF